MTEIVRKYFVYNYKDGLKIGEKKTAIEIEVAQG